MKELDIKYSEKKKFEAGKSEGLAEGEQKKALKVARNLLTMGLSVEQISEATGLSEEEVRML